MWARTRGSIQDVGEDAGLLKSGRTKWAASTTSNQLSSACRIHAGQPVHLEAVTAANILSVVAAAGVIQTSTCRCLRRAGLRAPHRRRCRRRRSP